MNKSDLKAGMCIRIENGYIYVIDFDLRFVDILRPNVKFGYSSVWEGNNCEFIFSKGVTTPSDYKVTHVSTKGVQYNSDTTNIVIDFDIDLQNSNKKTS